MDENANVQSTYEWHFLTQYPPGSLYNPLLIALFGERIGEETTANAAFAENLRIAAINAVSRRDNPVLIRQALQCLAHVGKPADEPALTPLLQNENAFVVRDVKTCLFEIKHR